jgi:hypothetical protein
MKQIKKLKLRTGQELNSLQQSFVVGGHVHNWVKPNGCSCNSIGNSHVEKCLNTESEWDPDWSGVLGSIVESGITRGTSGISGIVSGLLHCKTIVCYREMALISKNPKSHSCIKEWEETE